VITAVMTKPGDSLEPGQQLLEVSGHPLVALALPFGLYRDLAPGDSGRDVSAVQQALAALQLYSGSVDGQYGPTTAAGVRALFAHAGAAAPQPAADLVAAVQQAQTAVQSAQDALTDAQQAVAAQSMETTDAAAVSARDRAQRDLAAAQAALAAAKVAADTPLPSAEVLKVPAGGAVVVSVQGVGAGADANGNLAVLRAGDPTITTRVGVVDAKTLGMGAKATVAAATDASVTADATVTAVSAFQGTATTSGAPPGFDVTLTLASASGFTDGQSATVNPASAQPPVSGLAVPLTAVRHDNDGSYVLVVGPGSHAARATRVAVTITASADGYAVVGGNLHSGQLVLVARR
jgi:peptidoglycan hydrolase-like protein with peptidoglycan-binding domain